MREMNEFARSGWVSDETHLEPSQMDELVARNRSWLDEFLSGTGIADYLVSAGLTPDELAEVQARV